MDRLPVAKHGGTCLSMAKKLVMGEGAVFTETVEEIYMW